MNGAVKITEKALKMIQEVYVLIHDMEGKIPATARNNLSQIRDWSIAIINEINRILR